MTATTEQLMALLRDAEEFIDHTAICDVATCYSPWVTCTCGMRLLMVRVEEALAGTTDDTRARLTLIANALAQHDRCEDDDLPAKAASFLSEARQAAKPFLAEHATEEVAKLRAQVWQEMRGNYPGRPESSTPRPADLLDARQETIHVEQPAHRATPIGGDDDGN